MVKGQGDVTSSMHEQNNLS